MCYDLKYALRLCSEHNKQRACVHIYSTMGLFEEAVDLSLKVFQVHFQSVSFAQLFSCFFGNRLFS